MALAGCHPTAHAEQVTATRSPAPPSCSALSPTARSTVRRGAGRARTDRAELYAVLDAGLVCHLGVVLGDAPVVLPTAYGRGQGDRADTLYLHGSTGAGTLRAAATGAPVCVTVTHVDGVVYARSVFHFSMNYRSAVVHGRARLVTDHAERLAGLRAVTEHVAPGSWDHARPRPARSSPPPPSSRWTSPRRASRCAPARPSTTTRTSPPAAGGPASSRSAPSSTRRSPAPCCLRAPRPRRTSCPADGTPCRRAGELPSSHVTTAPAYPRAERLDLVDHLHGRAVADPYRWLEDPDDPRTREWSTAQDALARAHLDALPGRDRLATTLAALAEAGWVGAPVWRAGRRFATRREPGQEHGVLHVTEPDGAQRVLLDPVALDPTGLTTLDAWIPDHEGRLLAYQLSAGGDEQSVLHVLDVTTGHDVEEPIDRCRYSDVAWLPGGQEFFYVRMVAPDEVPPGEQAFHRRIWRHRVGAPTDTDVLVEGPGLY